MTITVHHLNNSRSQRILWLLEELGTEYEIVAYQRDAETNLAPPELKEPHPLGKSPLIEDEGLRVAESGAIIQYLCERHAGGEWLPDPASEEHVRHLEWMQFGESSFFVPVMLKIMAGRLGEGAAPIMPRIDEQFAAHVAFMEDGINEHGHFVGDSWTAADVMMSFPAEIAVMQGFAETAPKAARFVEKVHSRPAWQRARERGGPYFVW
ncbi:glutathione S-transferase [Qipengyuania sp. XHP0207]|uniref:glutathione S-transferase family protein n=1 Tax=Qipengyuania sp. XHP0207 TaxID=3038078 RepID=UPI00241F17D7|nr:glutathione S-transferase [Qipengyuania sp. XHP0207]MDG5747257.1 glutathione S-transferase [Qipengyuania sp. XHP0207]